MLQKHKLNKILNNIPGRNLKSNRKPVEILNLSNCELSKEESDVLKLILTYTFPVILN